MTAHPAKFSDVILERVVEVFHAFGWPQRVLDPFAGTGKIHAITQGRTTVSVGVEIEPEWATMHPRTIVGDALALPFPDASFDALCTSPCYGNRLADHHEAKDGSRRHSYRHVLGRALHPNSSGRLQWGEQYRAFHEAAWTESLRVLKPDALVILNSSNHVRNGQEQFVTEWHTNFFLDHGCAVLDFDTVNTRRLRHGANYTVRARYENVAAFRYVAPVFTPDDIEEDRHDSDHARERSELGGDVDASEGARRP